MKAQIVIFSSSSALSIAEGLQAQLSENYVCHCWKGEFFGENKTTPLWTFFKKLFHYDYVILVLSDDQMVQSSDGRDVGTLMPKDNVIFELGACMARLGPQKTIMVTPDQPRVHLPSYFDDVEPLIFHYTNSKPRTKKEANAATKAAADQIRALLDALPPGSFHAELPALGLAYAYQYNFLQPVLSSKKTQDWVIGGKPYHWTPETGVQIIIAMPEAIMNRDEVGAFMKANYHERVTQLPFAANDGRDLTVFVIHPGGTGEPLQIIDIPTTLLTTRNVVNRVEQFWRDKDSLKVDHQDAEFIKLLEAREILNFERAMEEIKTEFEGRVSIVPIEALSKIIGAG